jgi:hypothetical protein
MFTQNTDSPAYKGLLDGIKSVYRTDGARGLYRGLFPAVFGKTMDLACQGLIFQKLTSARSKTADKNPIVSID